MDIEDIKDRSYRFLRKTQKYTGTDNVYLAKSGFWLFSGQIVTSAVSFLLAIALANLLDPATYGNYKYVLSLAGVLAIFSLSGMGTAVIQAAARGLEGSFYTAFISKLKWSVIGSFAALGIAGYYWLKGNDILPQLLIVVAIFVPFIRAFTVYSGFLAGRKLFDVRIKYNIANQVLPAAAIIATILLTKNLFWIIVVYFVSHALLNNFLYFLTWFKFKPNKKDDPQTISYGAHLSLMGVIESLANYLDKILVFNLIGPVQLAVYSFAVVIPEQIQNVLKNINVLALPKLSANSREKIKKSLLKKTAKLFLLMVIMVGLYIAIIPYVYKIFFPKYIASVPFSQLFIVIFLFFPLSLLETAFKAKIAKKQLYWLKTIPLIRIILFAVLIPFFGIWGVIIARLVEQAFYSMLSLFFFRKF